MAKTLDVKTVTKIVGDKVRDIFHADAVAIMLLNTQDNLIHTLYEYDKGEGGYVDFMSSLFRSAKALPPKSFSHINRSFLGTLTEQVANGAYLPEMVEKSSGISTEFCIDVCADRDR